jgi:hypothetical protein
MVILSLWFIYFTYNWYISLQFGAYLDISGDARNGGGLISSAAKKIMFVVTAGHCAKVTPKAAECGKESACDDTGSSTDEFRPPDNSAVSSVLELVITDNFLDCAVLPLLCRPNALHCANPWCMDDDVYANEDFYTALVRSTRLSFDSSNDSITPDDDFPVLSADVLVSGTAIVKIGSTTGNTMGQLIGVQNVNYTEGTQSHKVVGAIVVQWEPGQRFISGGDSGSVYYAKLGSPIFATASLKGSGVDGK